jgi:hypothetical protein
MIALLLILILVPSKPLKDDGFGVCPAFTHYHADWRTEDVTVVDPKDRARDFIYLDGKCHRDDSDEPINAKPDLKKRKPKPDPKDKWL